MSVLQGIKVVDAESKQRVLDILKQEQAEKLMEVDDSAAAAAAKPDSSSKKKAKKRSKVKLVTKTMTGTTSRKGAEPAAMED
jgi:aromatic ring-opening dioxygenase LigB subunit